MMTRRGLGAAGRPGDLAGETPAYESNHQENRRGWRL